MFRRFRIPVLWILLLSSLATAQVPPGAPAQANPHRFLMWKATSPTVTVFLVGSIHVGDTGMYPLPREVESAFASAKVLAVEVNLLNIDQSKATEFVMQRGLYGANDGLSKHISAETSAALDDFCKQHGLPRAAVEQMKPWVAAVTIAATAWKEAGEDPQLGIDMHFLNESKQPQRIDEFESMESQLNLFTGATEEEQQALLASTLKESGKLGALIKRIQAAYLSGDPNALQQVMDEEADMGTKSLTKKFLDDRNVTMAARIDEYLKAKEPVFVVVGAAHIIGEKGVAKLLRDKGYKVEQVTLETR